MNKIILSCKKCRIAYEDPNIIKSKYSNVRIYNRKAFLTYNKNLYLTFCGTKDVQDIIDNIDIRHRTIIHDNIKVHKGFHDQFFSIEDQITEDIKTILSDNNIKDIIISGHSAGGMNAQIAAPYYGELLKRNVTCITYGTVTCGNKGFIDWFTKNIKKNYRFETEGDILPYIPVYSNFHHVPNGIRLLKNGLIETEYDIKPYSYLELLQIILDKEKLINIYDDHSCDNYYNHLINLDKNNSIFK
jgi:hypothetical protein